MNAERWEEVWRIVEAAEAVPPEGRAAYLEEACQGDGELKTEVESLLASSEKAGAFLDHPLSGDPRGSGHPRRDVGPYRLLDEIGQGGMGIVYRAIRRDQGFERHVAVKLVKRGMDTDFVLRRFERERRILAGLDQPNIARVLDGGETSDGLPYFVMELIEGRDLIRYCEEEKLDTRRRLALFRQVCSAVTYAHQRLVIHRDIKPSNILVTADGVPKLLDFGLARVLAREAGETVDRTETALRVLTPEYASPEQVRGEELTTATDVYSLGVVLYELLTGERPYRLKGRSPEEVSDAVLHQEPAKPGTKARLHRDLDAIVMMALRKEPARRYASAEQLSEDIRRHLEGLPVKATPDRFGYRAGKFIRRHRLGMAGGAIVAASLVGGLAVAVSERNQARAHAVRAEETARFLGSIFEGANPVQTRGKTLTARELLDRGAERIQRELQGQPEVQASLMVVMANAYYRLSATREALALAERALALRERVLPARSLTVAESLYQVGSLRRRLGQSARALPLLERAAAIREAVLGTEHPDSIAALRARVMALNDLGRAGEALPLLEGAIRVQERSAPRSVTLALLHNSLGILHLERGDPAAARRDFESSIAVYEKLSGPEEWGIAMPLVNLGDLLRDEEDFAAAEPLFLRVLAIDEKTFGKESDGVAYALARLGNVKHALGDDEAARRLLEQSLKTYGAVGSSEYPGVADPLTYLGEVCLSEKKPGEARQLFERALAITERAHGPEHPKVPDVLVPLARSLDSSGDRSAAQMHLRRALAIQRKSLAPDHRALVPTLTALARILSEEGRGEEARPLLTEAVSIARAKLPERHSQRLAAEAALKGAGT